MKLKVLAFATAREILGAAELEVELATDAPTVADLRDELLRRTPSLASLWPRLATAVDGELATADTALTEGAEVALLPPVSGGAPARARLTEDPLEPSSVAALVGDPGHGATVLFLGTVRDSHRGRAVEAITYDAYRRLAATTLETILGELESEVPGLRLAAAHRLGPLEVGEISVVLAASSPHREAAYDGCRELLERLKKRVPIWKREHYADGTARWREEESLVG